MPKVLTKSSVIFVHGLGGDKIKTWTKGMEICSENGDVILTSTARWCLLAKGYT